MLQRRTRRFIHQSLLYTLYRFLSVWQETFATPHAHLFKTNMQRHVAFGFITCVNAFIWCWTQHCMSVSVTQISSFSAAVLSKNGLKGVVERKGRQLVNRCVRTGQVSSQIINLTLNVFFLPLLQGVEFKQLITNKVHSFSFYWDFVCSAVGKLQRFLNIKQLRALLDQEIAPKSM